ncbi:MAG TPA: membrane dipeptidase [Anaerolineales bacterium]|nr:membrane dipeptidase [Anaerolineales bacterium]
MHLIIDSHEDIAWNMLTFQRDYTRPLAETRRLEANTLIPGRNGDSLLGWDEYQRGRVAVVFATLFAAPARKRELWDTLWYPDFDTARRLYRDQILLYHKLTDSHPDKFRLIPSTKELDSLLELWSTPARDSQDEGRPVGLILLMEGAEGIRHVDELREWWELGLRMIGPAWLGTRYCGGTKEPGPLTEEGRTLLSEMSDFNFILDLSHMDEAAALESLDHYEGPIMASHANCAALMPGADTNRHLPDRVIHGLIERGGVIGSVPFNTFLRVGWARQSGSRREEVGLDAYIAHIDHVCQLAGDSLHAGIGSDFDGGFGLQSVPPGIESVADLQLVGSKLLERGYNDTDVENILGGNWLRFLREHLP